MSNFIINNNTRAIYLDDTLTLPFDAIIKMVDGKVVNIDGTDAKVRRYFEQPEQPENGMNGDRWFDTDDGSVYEAILINDELQWVEA